MMCEHRSVVGSAKWMVCAMRSGQLCRFLINWSIESIWDRGEHGDAAHALVTKNLDELQLPCVVATNPSGHAPPRPGGPEDNAQLVFPARALEQVVAQSQGWLVVS